MKKKNLIWLGVAPVVLISAVSVIFFTINRQGKYVGNIEKVKLGISKSFLSIPVYIAKKQGFFADEGLDVTVEEFSSGKKATESMLNGEIDISTVADMPVVFNSFVRQDFCIVATFNASYSFIEIIARKDRGINTGADLKGKKIGVNKGTSSQFFLGVFLIHNGILISEVEIVNIKTVDLPEALYNGHVDAISVWQPYTQEARRLLQDQAAKIPGSEIYRTTFNFAVLRSFAEDNKETIIKLLRAIDKAAVFIKNNRVESEEIISESFKVAIEDVDDLWDGYFFELSMDQSLLTSWDSIARWAIKSGLVDNTKIPNYLDFMFLDALEAIKPESLTIIR